MEEEIWLPGVIHRETEFVDGLTGACGPNAASMAERWADQSQLSTLDVYRRMRVAGRADENGTSTLAALVADARDAGYTLDVLAYREPMPEAAWRQFFTRYVGQRAIVFEMANGQALRDELSGKGENARNLKYHFVMVTGWHPGGKSRQPQARGRTLPAGWWCCDGANFASGDVMQFYADGVLAAARPCGAMAVAPRVPLEEGGETMGGVPTGWSDDGTTLVAPNKVPVVKGFRARVLTGPWDARDWPLAAEYGSDSIEPGNPAIGAGTRQDFRMTSLGWTESRGVYRIWTGQDLRALSAQVADLERQLAALKRQGDGQGDGQNNGAGDEAVRKALAAIAALKEALG